MAVIAAMTSVPGRLPQSGKVNADYALTRSQSDLAQFLTRSLANWVFRTAYDCILKNSRDSSEITPKEYMKESFLRIF